MSQTTNQLASAVQPNVNWRRRGGFASRLTVGERRPAGEPSPSGLEPANTGIRLGLPGLSSAEWFSADARRLLSTRRRTGGRCPTLLKPTATDAGSLSGGDSISVLRGAASWRARTHGVWQGVEVEVEVEAEAEVAGAVATGSPASGDAWHPPMSRATRAVATGSFLHGVSSRRIASISSMIAIAASAVSEDLVAPAEGEVGEGCRSARAAIVTP